VVILDQAITGEIGNGKVSVLTVEDAMRVRTGKTGDTSLG
jgi:nitrogen regulatory protein PII